MSVSRPLLSRHRLAVVASAAVCLALAAWNGWIWGASGWRAVLAVSPQRDIEGILNLTRAVDETSTGPLRVWVEGECRWTSGGLVLAPGSTLRLATDVEADQVDLALSGAPPTAMAWIAIGDGRVHALGDGPNRRLGYWRARTLEETTQRTDGARRRYPLLPGRAGLWIGIGPPAGGGREGEREGRISDLRFEISDGNTEETSKAADASVSDVKSQISNPPRRDADASVSDVKSQISNSPRRDADASVSDVKSPISDPSQPDADASVSDVKSQISNPPEGGSLADALTLWEVRYSFANRRANRLPPVSAILATILTTGLLLWLTFQKDPDGAGLRATAGSSDGFAWILRFAVVLFGAAISISLKSWDLTAGWEWGLILLEAAIVLAGAGVVRGQAMTRDGFVLNLRSARVLWILAAIFMIGIHARWGGFVDHRRQPLLPDAAGFLEIVESGAWYATAASEGPWVREPLWVWVNRVAGWVLGLNENTLRLVSLVAGLLAILQVARLGARWFGPAVGLIAAAGFAVSPRWAEWTALGLRTEFLTLVILTFVYEWDCRAVDRRREKSTTPDGAPQESDEAHPDSGADSGPAHFVRGSAYRDSDARWCDALVLGGLAAAAHLTYISSLSWTFPFLAWRGWRDRRPARWFAACVVVAVIPLLPHLAFNYSFRDSRDPFFSSNIHAKYYRNYEKHGLPGSPDREVFLKEPYGGPPVTTLGYILGDHTVAQLAGGSIRGVWNIYVYRVAGIEQFRASKSLTLIYAFGVAVALFSRAGRRSLALWVWIGLPFLLLASLPGFATRLLAPLTPWMWFYLALGGVKVVGLTWSLFAGGRIRGGGKG